MGEISECFLGQKACAKVTVVMRVDY